MEAYEPKELAIEFRRAIQARPELVGLKLSSEWIRCRYLDFCAALRVDRLDAPPYKDFANELAKLMPRSRREVRQGGKRVGTYTRYLVPDPATGLVALSEEKLKRA